MMVRYFLLHLPVHRRSFDRYYSEHDREVAQRKPEVEREWGQPFDELPPHIRIYFKDQWYWPPWFFNDAIGFLRVGSDGESALAADVFLERRFFPSTALEKFGRHGDVQEEDEIVYLASIGKHPVELGDNATYLVALAEIISEARKTVRQQGDEIPEAEIWVPGYDLSCFDLARADAQLRERFPERMKETEPPL